jgi:tripartite-type tricarboxylate transporter receptor subunit TctC
MGGETQASFMTTTQALPLIKAGKVKALAYDYPTRASFLPDLPTMKEAGSVPSDLDSGWHGVFVPANTPDPVVKWLETEIRKAVATPEMQSKLKNLGLIPVGSSAADFRQMFEKSIKDMANAARVAGIQPR